MMSSSGTEHRIPLPRVIAVACCVALAIAGIVFGLGLYRSSVSGSDDAALPMPLGFGLAVVMSGSMSPALEVDDLVIVQPQDTYEAGDIVVYQSGDSLVTHRVIGWDGSMLVTQGDANNVPDEPVSADVVQGAVTLRVPFVGAAVGALKTPVVLIIVLLGVFALVALSSRTQRRERDAELGELEAEVSRLKTELTSGRKEE